MLALKMLHLLKQKIENKSFFTASYAPISEIVYQSRMLLKDPLELLNADLSAVTNSSIRGLAHGLVVERSSQGHHVAIRQTQPALL